ncbi:hypothetical protein VPH35_012716 [Triticum aestivum]
MAHHTPGAPLLASTSDLFQESCYHTTNFLSPAEFGLVLGSWRSTEFYYQTRLSVVDMMYDIRFELEAPVGNGYISVHMQSYCQQREVSVSHGKLEKLVPTLWQQLECRETCGRQTTTGC